jgi:uncharacterized protein YlxP (DUF503 family)
MALVVGVCQVELLLHGCQSLKEKRQVLQSLLERLRNRFNVSVAEIGHQDLWQRALIGAAVVSNSQPLMDRTLAKILDQIENTSGVEMIDCLTEVW